MRIGDSMGVAPNSIQLNNSPILAQLNEFSSSSLESKDNAGKEPGIVSKAVNAILYVPKMIISGVWTLVKYAIWFSTCGICCKPGYNPKVLQEAIQKVINAEDKKAAWDQFKKNFPRATDQLIKFAIDHEREVDMGPKDMLDPKKVAEWNKEHLASKREALLKRFDAQDIELLNQAVGYLQQLIDAKVKM